MEGVKETNFPPYDSVINSCMQYTFPPNIPFSQLDEQLVSKFHMFASFNERYTKYQKSLWKLRRNINAINDKNNL